MNARMCSTSLSRQCCASSAFGYATTKPCFAARSSNWVCRASQVAASRSPWKATRSAGRFGRRRGMSTSSPATSWWPLERKHAAAFAGCAVAGCPDLACAPPQPAASRRSSSALRRRLRLAFLLAQLDPADLPRQRLRQVVDELDAPRIGVLREPVTHERADLARELVARLVTLRKHDERLDDVAA